MSVQIHDISMPLTSDVAVFPGDTPPTREMLLDMQQGDHLTLSTLHSTVHLGTHIDGPCHYAQRWGWRGIHATVVGLWPRVGD